MKHLDLFSGIGGFALAARWAEIETIGFCEIDPFCRKVLMKHWPGVLKYMDIKDLANPDHVDILTAGFPCQPFSIAGKRKGINDERYLWPEVMRIITKSKPHWFIGENVSGVVEMELDNILDDLEKEDYKTRAFIIPACASNAPHRRDRVWIIANRSCERCDMRPNPREKRYLQDDKEWDIETLQSEWEKFKPKSWATCTAKSYLAANAHISRMDDGISNRLDRIKSLGNAIVPQVAYVFMKLIKTIDNL